MKQFRISAILFVTITLLHSAFAFDNALARAQSQTVVESTKVSVPPTVDGVVGANEWDQSGRLVVPHGVLFVQHTQNDLYILIDLTEDTHDDPIQSTSPWGDYFELTFDINGDGLITPNTDLNFSIYQNYTLRKQYYLNASTWTALTSTPSVLSEGFGPSNESSTPHRIWEFRFDRNEVTMSQSMNAYLGVRVYSVQPSFYTATPTNMTTDFSDLIRVQMGMDCNGNGVEDSQDITTGTSQDADGDGLPDECANQPAPMPAGCGGVGCGAGAFPFMLLCLGLLRFLPRRWE